MTFTSKMLRSQAYLKTLLIVLTITVGLGFMHRHYASNYSPSTSEIAVHVDRSGDSTSNITKRTEEHSSLYERENGEESDDHESYDPSDSHLTFKTLAKEGGILLEAIATSAEEATDILEEEDLLEIDTSSQSHFTRRNDLLANGWIRANSDQEPLKDFRFSSSQDPRIKMDVPLLNELRSMRISTSIATKGGSGANYVVGWHHYNKRVIDGITYFPTEAEYINVYNPTNGAIIAFLNYSPLHMIESDPVLKDLYPEIQMPPLHEWSDVVFLQYKELCADPRVRARLSGLKYIFFSREDNGDIDDVMDVVRVALDPINEHPLGDPVIPGWKRKLTYGMSQEAGKALLGSRLGQRVAWLLISRKAELGHKRVKSVSIWMDGQAVADKSEQTDPSVMFELEDALGSGTTGTNPSSTGSLGPGAGYKRPHPSI